MSEDKLIIEAKGTKIEVPLHMTKIELHKDWRNNEQAPELIIRAVGRDEKETEKWGELYAKVCWKGE